MTKGVKNIQDRKNRLRHTNVMGKLKKKNLINNFCLLKLYNEDRS